jgi:hypothetical protein
MKKEGYQKDSEIDLWLDSYEDIFSDFDPRPNCYRALSKDFLEETKRASIDKKKGKLELKFFIPRKLRNEKEEAVIKNRLLAHFSRHEKNLRKQLKKMILTGIAFIIIGVLLMFITTFLIDERPEDKISIFFSVLFNPAGWYLLWEGLNLIIFKPGATRTEFNFYHKMKDANIHFKEYRQEK